MLRPSLMGQRIGYRLLLASALLALIVSENASAQTTAFTYQGKLNDNGNPASGPYDFQFKLFNTATVGTGTQQGSTVDISNVQVTGGIFTVQLDFGAAVFPGTDRFLEISVRPAGGGALTILAPRQAVTSTPYALRSTTAGAADTASNATQLGGLTSSGFIQNTTSQQAATNFNIGGTGTASVLNAATQFNLGGSRILSNAGTNNLFAGVNAGASNTTGALNSFFGRDSGVNNTTGINNSFFGSSAGLSNSTGSVNSFFGNGAGANNTTGGLNSFFGRDSGFFNTTGSSNVFVGNQTGSGNTTGSNNTIIGILANVGANNLTFATAIGSGAVVNSSNTLVLGRSEDTVQIPGALNATGAFSSSVVNATTQYNLGGSRILSNAGSNNLFVGMNTGPNSTGTANAFFGAFAGESNTSGFSNSFFGTSAGLNNTTGAQNSFFGVSSGLGNTTGTNNAFFGSFSGAGNTTGQQNAFFGSGAGSSNTTGKHNSFFGQAAANQNTTGEDNSFFGWFAGLNNQTGIGNTFIGQSSGFDSTNTTGHSNTLLGSNTTLPPGLSNATAIGFNARVTQSNSLVLGSGVNVGIGTTAPGAKLHIKGVDEGIRIQGPATGDPNLAYLSFVDSAETRIGYVGDGSSSDKNVFLASDNGDVALITSAGRVLTATSGGKVGIGIINPTLAKLQVESGGVGVGVYASAPVGVYGDSSNAFGAGVQGNNNTDGIGVYGTSSSGAAVHGFSISGNLIVGENLTGTKFRVANNGTVHAPAYQGLPDFAEEIRPSLADKSRLEPGDVLVAAPDSDRSVTRSRKPYSTSVLGVYSTAPGFIGTERPIEGASFETIPMAVIGIVPCKVSAENGPIRRGDLLTTSRTPGHAMRCANHRRCSGAIVGKALATLDSGTGVIKVLVTLQ